MRREPRRLELDSQPRRVSSTTSSKSCCTKCGSMKRSCSVVSQSHERRMIRLLPETRDAGTQQHLLRQGSSARAAASRTRGTRRGPAGPTSVSGENNLSMQNSARCVLPVTSTSRWRNTRSTSHGGQCPLLRHLLERDPQLVRGVAPPFVDARRLARRANEHARKQIRQRRMVVPIGHQAPQQIGPPQKRAVGRRRPAEHHMIAAAGAGVRAVEIELFGAQPRQSRVFVDAGRDLYEFVPIVRPDGC